MRKVSLAIIVLIVNLGAVEITPVLGGSCHVMYQPIFFDRVANGYGRLEDGLGYTAGVLGDFFVSDPVTPENLSIQTGIMFQHIRYRDVSVYYRPYRYNNLMLPLTVNTNSCSRRGIPWFLGAGPVLIHNMWGSEGDRDEPYSPPSPLQASDLRTYFGALVKGGISIDVGPRLSLKPSGTLQFNLSRSELREWTFYLSLGLAFKL